MNTKNLDTYRWFDHAFSWQPGISQLNPWTLRAMMRPASTPGQTFWDFYNETIDMMKGFLHTKATLVPIIGPGRVAMDAVINNFIEPGDKLLLIENGYWGRYMEQMAPTYNCNPVIITSPVDKPVNLEILESKLKEEKNVKVVHIVHVETETGIVNPVRKIGEIVHKYVPDALYVVDSATGFPGNKIEIDDWGIDINYFVSHKGFNAPSGLNFMTINEKALKIFRNRETLPHGWYNSLQTLMETWVEYKSGGKHCLESFPSLILFAIRSKLDLMTQMGEDKYLKKYELASKAIRMGLRKMTDPENLLMVPGPRCENCPGCDYVDPNIDSKGFGRFCSQTTACIAYPEKINWQNIVKNFEERYWMTGPHAGFGDHRKGGFWYGVNGMHVGTVNDQQHYPRNILAVIAAIGFCLRDAGMEQIKWERGVEAANKVLEEMQKDLKWNYQAN